MIHYHNDWLPDWLNIHRYSIFYSGWDLSQGDKNVEKCRETSRNVEQISGGTFFPKKVFTGLFFKNWVPSQANRSMDKQTDTHFIGPLTNSSGPIHKHNNWQHVTGTEKNTNPLISAVMGLVSVNPSKMTNFYLIMKGERCIKNSGNKLEISWISGIQYFNTWFFRYPGFSYNGQYSGQKSWFLPHPRHLPTFFPVFFT